MALIHCDIYSEALQLSTSFYVILPQPKFGARPISKPDQKIPVLYLLHGLSDDHSMWMRRTSIERYVEGRNLAVVMPAVQRSFYTNMIHGGRFWTYISEELPFLVQTLFNISPARKFTFVAGLSMGGYGAFRLALTHPDRYAAAASLSGALDITEIIQSPEPEWQEEMTNMFGDLTGVAGSKHDLFALARKVAASREPKPALYAWCGKQDFLYKQNVRFNRLAESLNLPLTYSASAGDHQWKYWDVQIQNVLDWLPLPLPTPVALPSPHKVETPAPATAAGAASPKST
jgi:Predicted esterase